MNKIAAVSYACLMLMLSACGSHKQDQTSATTPPPPGTGPVKISSSNVFSPLVQDLNKAKQVNNQVQQQAQAANKSLENDSTPSASTAGP